MANSLVTKPYKHDVSVGVPMVPSSGDAQLGVVPVGNADGTPISFTGSVTAAGAMADGADVAEGALADAAVAAGAAGTVSAKLRRLTTDVDAVKTSVASIDAKVTDNATQTTLAGIKTGTDKIPASPAQEGGNLATLAGIVSAAKAATKSADGDFVTVGAKADTAITDSTTTNTLMSFIKGLVKIFADVWDNTNHVLNTGVLTSVSATVTRPADTNAYAALDTISDSTSAPTVLTFSNMAKGAGKSGYITKAVLATDQKTNTARFRLHLFNAAPSAINDNSPYTTLFTNIANRVGTIDFSAVATEDPTNSTQATSTLVPGSGNVPLAFVCAADANLYGILETLDVFTPASGQKITIKLTADQN